MKKSTCPIRATGSVLIGTLVIALAGCTTYVQRPAPRAAYLPQPPPPAYVQPTEAPVYAIQAASDFYGPLSPYGVWVSVPGYGLCWKPAQVNAIWRPYANGRWEWTDTGWYWASDEPWGWATYHYGRWDLTAQFGWVWVPQTQWGPAWVSWRTGAGYVGWAPLPPSARFEASGVMDVQGQAIAPKEFVFVQEHNLLAPVGPQTVIINNTTIINQTVHITSVKMVNRAVFNEGPRAQDIERVSGRKLLAVPVRDLRHREETEASAWRRNRQPTGEHFVQSPPPRQPSAPTHVVPQRELHQPKNPKPVTPQSPPAAPRNANRVTVPPNRPFHYTVPPPQKPAQNASGQNAENRRPEPVANPTPIRPQPERREAKPVEAPRQVTAPVQKRLEVRPQPQTRTARSRPAAPQRTPRPRVVKKGAQVLVEKIGEPLPKKPSVNKQRRTNGAPSANRKQDKEANAPAGHTDRPQNQGRR